MPLVFRTGDAVQIDWCQVYLTHTVTGKKADVGTLLLEEQSRLFPLLGYPYDPAKRAGVRVTPFSTARYDTNSYSVLVKFCGSIVSIKTLPERIEFYAHGNLIAAHNRQQNIYQMAHYLPLPEQKGRAIFQAKPVRDHVPEYFLDWLTRQTLKPKEPVALPERSPEIGVDAVMRGEVPTVPEPTQEIHDFVQIAAVHLFAYDRLSRGCKEAAV